MQKSDILSCDAGWTDRQRLPRLLLTALRSDGRGPRIVARLFCHHQDVSLAGKKIKLKMLVAQGKIIERMELF